MGSTTYEARIQNVSLFWFVLPSCAQLCVLQISINFSDPITCDLLWCNREQVARQMFLIITCTLSYDYLCIQPNTMPHSIDVVRSCVTSLIIVKVSLCYWKRVLQILIGMPWVIVSDKNSLQCWFLLNEKLVPPTSSLFRQSRSHINHMVLLPKLTSPCISAFRFLVYDCVTKSIQNNWNLKFSADADIQNVGITL